MTSSTSAVGTKQLYFLVGEPLAAAKSPALLNTLFSETEENAMCVPCEVSAAALPNFVVGARALHNLGGLLVTMPHKERMLEFVDDLDETAKLVGALNVIRCEDDGRWVGAMFDGLGCVLGMKWGGYDPAGKAVLLIGAGGAGRAIAFALASAGARRLGIHDIDGNRSESLALAVFEGTGCRAAATTADAKDYQIVINATSLGMRPDDPMPMDPSTLDSGTAVIDIVISPVATALCRAAQARGCPTQDGRAMHEGQAVQALRFLGYDYQPQAEKGRN